MENRGTDGGVTVREVMTPDVATIAPESTLRELVELLVDRGVSGVPVVGGGTVLGVVSVTDLMEFEADAPPIPAEWGEEPGWNPWAPAPESSEDDDSPAAFFSDLWDDDGAELVERFRAPGAPEWDGLGEHTISEVMTHGVLTVEPGDSLRDAAGYMLRARVHRLLVVDDGTLVGILTATDLLKAVAAHGVHARLPDWLP